MKLRSLCLPLLCCIAISCNNASEQKPAQTTTDTATTKEVEETHSAIVSVPEQTAAVIVSRSWPLPSPDWSKAKEQTFSDTIKFNKVKAEVIVKFTTLTLDSSYMVKELSINSYKEDSKYALTGTILEQLNGGTTTAIEGFVQFTVFANLKPRQRSTLKLESKAGAAIAKDGTVMPL